MIAGRGSVFVFGFVFVFLAWLRHSTRNDSYHEILWLGLHCYALLQHSSKADLTIILRHVTHSGLPSTMLMRSPKPFLLINSLAKVAS